MATPDNDSSGAEDNNTSPPFNDPSHNPSSPFHIHPSESPSSVIVTPALSANNFQSRSRSIRIALISNNKMGFLNGSIPKPAFTDPLYPHRERCNTLLMSWLLNSLSPSIAQSVIFFEISIDIWTDLRERFSQGDLLHVAELQEEIYALKQGNNNVNDYYTNLKSLWEELDNFRPLLPCSCSVKTFHQQDFIIRFLKGLDDCFSMNRGIPHSGRAIANKKCDHYGRLGHTIEVCYQKHGSSAPKCEHLRPHRSHR
uniref:Retrotransposon gag domain-containing protein n=1 Tax=Cajanus cajan TaxID=3821 RepID=A0A151R641_CAJCA|nr:hypothetical protein KK1_040937 [Cajanus cajan]